MAKGTFQTDTPVLTRLSPPQVTISLLRIRYNAGFVNQARVMFSGSADSQYIVAIYCSSPISPGAMYAEPAFFRFIAASSIELNPAIMFFTTQLTARFNYLEVGDKVFLKFVLMDPTSGQTYNIGQYPTIVEQQ